MLSDIWVIILNHCSYQDVVNVANTLYLLQKKTGIDYNVNNIISTYLSNKLSSNRINKYVYHLYLDLHTNSPIASHWTIKKYMHLYSKIYLEINKINRHDDLAKTKTLLRILHVKLEKDKHSIGKLFRNITLPISKKYSNCPKIHHKKHDNICSNCQQIKYWQCLLKLIP